MALSLLLHHRQIVGPSELTLGELLARKGITAFVVSTFCTSTLKVELDNPFQDYIENDLLKVFSARELLKTHPLVDPDRIGIIGGSRGGTVADLATREEYYSHFSPDGAPFDFHVAFYPTIYKQQVTLRIAPTPILYLSGDQDAFVHITSTQAYINRLKAAGYDATFHVYEGAAHGFEDPNSKDCFDREFPVVSMEKAAIAYDEQGFIPLENGVFEERVVRQPKKSWDELFSHLSNNAFYGFKVAYHPEAAQKAMQDLLIFLKEKGKLTLY